MTAVSVHCRLRRKLAHLLLIDGHPARRAFLILRPSMRLLRPTESTIHPAPTVPAPRLGALEPGATSADCVERATNRRSCQDVPNQNWGNLLAGSINADRQLGQPGALRLRRAGEFWSM